MKKNVFSTEIRNAALLEVAEKHRKLIELEDERKRVMAEYSRLDEEVRTLNRALEDACECFGIDYQADYDDEGNYIGRKYFLED
jgi:hypothetical protein